jgi:hypothetical protein
MHNFSYGRFTREYEEEQKQRRVEEMNEMALDKLFPALGKTEKALAEYFKRCDICQEMRGEWEVVGVTVKGRVGATELRVCASCDYWLKQNDYNFNV